MNKRWLMALLPALCCGQALAWARDGHETVGLIAAKLIADTEAERRVAALLEPGESLATAAEWPDCAKGKTYCNRDLTPEMKDYGTRRNGPLPRGQLVVRGSVRFAQLMGYRLALLQGEGALRHTPCDQFKERCLECGEVECFLVKVGAATLQPVQAKILRVNRPCATVCRR